MVYNSLLNSHSSIRSYVHFLILKLTLNLSILYFLYSLFYLFYLPSIPLLLSMSISLFLSFVAKNSSLQRFLHSIFQECQILSFSSFSSSILSYFLFLKITFFSSFTLLLHSSLHSFFLVHLLIHILFCSLSIS